ncbi:hypothetical protein M5D96_003854, partial [Drosophila gunungcola]
MKLCRKTLRPAASQPNQKALMKRFLKLRVHWRESFYRS